MSGRTVRLVVVAISFLLYSGAATAHPRFGLVGGPQVTDLVAGMDDDSPRQALRWTATGFAGAMVEVPLPGRLVLATGIEYGQHSDEQTLFMVFPAIGPTPVGESRLELRQLVLSSPVRLEWRPRHWRVGVGPELRYLVRADQRWRLFMPSGTPANLAAARGRVARPAAPIFESVRPDVWYDATSVFRRWSLAASLAVGREVPLGAHALRADLRWSEGITHQQWAAAAAQRTRAAQLSFAWLW